MPSPWPRRAASTRWRSRAWPPTALAGVWAHWPFLITSARSAPPASPAWLVPHVAGPRRFWRPRGRRCRSAPRDDGDAGPQAAHGADAQYRVVRTRDVHRSRLGPRDVDRARPRPGPEPDGGLLLPAVGAADADGHRDTWLAAGDGALHRRGLRERRARARLGFRTLLHAPPAGDDGARDRRGDGDRADRGGAAAARVV